VLSTLRFFRHEYLELLNKEADIPNGEAKAPAAAAGK
jgi:hypothetical protein